MLARGSQQRVDGTLEDDLAALAAGLGADFDDMVGRADHGFVVLDDDHGVAGVRQRPDDADQAVDVARVQADAGLVEHKEGVDQRSAEARGEVDAFDFASAQRARGAVEGEIAEADLLQVAQAGDDGIIGEVGGMGCRAARRAGQAWPRPRPGRAGRRRAVGRVAGRVRPRHFQQSASGCRRAPAAGRAAIVGPVAGEEDPHVHLVGLGLEVPEETLEPVPGVRPGLARLVVVRVAIDDEILLLRRQGGKRHVGRDLELFAKT